MKKVVAVIGTSSPSTDEYEYAFELGKRLADEGYVVLTGGLGGVMEAALKGARDRGGITVGVIPTYSKSDANEFVDIPVLTGMGHARNVVVAASGDVVVAVGGEYGTISEIAIALKLGKRVIGYKAPPVKGVENVTSVEEAVERVMRHTGGSGSD